MCYYLSAHFEFTLVQIVHVFAIRNSSCGKVMFSQACVKNSVPLHAGIHISPVQTPPGRHPPGQTLFRQTPPGQTPPWADTPPETATAADGTHPTAFLFSVKISALTDALLENSLLNSPNLNRHAKYKFDVFYDETLVKLWFRLKELRHSGGRKRRRLELQTRFIL